MEAAPGNFDLRFDCAGQLVGLVLAWWRRGRRRGSQEIDGVLDTLKLHVGLDYTEASAGWKRGIPAARVDSHRGTERTERDGRPFAETAPFETRLEARGKQDGPFGAQGKGVPPLWRREVCAID